jgi:uncharacterized protein (DUF58 family)
MSAEPLRARARSWALRRQGSDALPLQLAPRRIYILPTGAGWSFGLLVFAMFVAGMNYGNGLVLLLTFWMTGFALVAMIHTQRGLAAARITRAVAQPAFAGGSVLLEIDVHCGLAAGDVLLKAEGGTSGQSIGTGPGHITLGLRFPASRRGRWRAPVLRLETRAPFGMFCSWTWLQLDAGTLVYPQPRGEAPLPESDDASGSRPRQSGTLDELAGLRAFREGDSPRQVAWKAYARGAPLLVREYQGQAGQTSILDYASLPMRGAEARLSQLARWMTDPQMRDLRWTLRLPRSADISGHGRAHRQRCLEALALFQETGP